MEIRHLRYFCVLAEQLHFTKAAVLVNVTQPALSRQIKQLEEELGAQLVERSNRRVRPTAAGEVFLARAARILDQLNQAAREPLLPANVLSSDLLMLKQVKLLNHFHKRPLRATNSALFFQNPLRYL
jgi:DNA-binding transcriptional LysR family regulator